MFYERERGTTVYSGRPTEWEGEVGLMYPSDYGYATSGGTTTDRETCLATDLLNWGYTDFDSSDCYNNDWLYELSYLKWTLTSRSSDSSHVFYVDNSGNVSSYYPVNNAYEVRPSVYLTSEVRIFDGEGTRENPYILEV